MITYNENEFRVGSTVRINRADCPNYRKIGTILDTDEDHYKVLVKFLKSDHKWYHVSKLVFICQFEMESA